MRDERGFSLLELVVVVVIVSLLALAAIIIVLPATLHAQRLPSSYIIRVKPGVGAKTAHQQITSTGNSLGVELASRQLVAVSSAHSLLSASRLDRYIVVDAPKGASPDLLDALGQRGFQKTTPVGDLLETTGNHAPKPCFLHRAPTLTIRSERSNYTVKNSGVKDTRASLRASPCSNFSTAPRTMRSIVPIGGSS